MSPSYFLRSVSRPAGGRPSQAEGSFGRIVFFLTTSSFAKTNRSGVSRYTRAGRKTGALKVVVRGRTSVDTAEGVCLEGC